jgi:glycine cleavage system aminomethyltransferase T
MTETIAETTIRQSPLGDIHRRSGAVLAERDGWEVPASYGDVLLEFGRA